MECPFGPSIPQPRSTRCLSPPASVPRYLSLLASVPRYLNLPASVPRYLSLPASSPRYLSLPAWVPGYLNPQPGSPDTSTLNLGPPIPQPSTSVPRYLSPSLGLPDTSAPASVSPIPQPPASVPRYLSPQSGSPDTLAPILGLPGYLSPQPQSPGAGAVSRSVRFAPGAGFVTLRRIGKQLRLPPRDSRPYQCCLNKMLPRVSSARFADRDA